MTRKSAKSQRLTTPLILADFYDKHRALNLTGESKPIIYDRFIKGEWSIWLLNTFHTLCYSVQVTGLVIQKCRNWSVSWSHRFYDEDVHVASYCEAKWSLYSCFANLLMARSLWNRHIQYPWSPTSLKTRCSCQSEKTLIKLILPFDRNRDAIARRQSAAHTDQRLFGCISFQGCLPE